MFRNTGQYVGQGGEIRWKPLIQRSIFLRRLSLHKLWITMTKENRVWNRSKVNRSSLIDWGNFFSSSSTKRGSFSKFWKSKWKLISFSKFRNGESFSENFRSRFTSTFFKVTHFKVSTFHVVTHFWLGNVKADLETNSPRPTTLRSSISKRRWNNFGHENAKRSRFHPSPILYFTGYFVVLILRANTLILCMNTIRYTLSDKESRRCRIASMKLRFKRRDTLTRTELILSLYSF